jgi:hypothetical protein
MGASPLTSLKRNKSGIVVGFKYRQSADIKIEKIFFEVSRIRSILFLAIFTGLVEDLGGCSLS